MQSTHSDMMRTLLRIPDGQLRTQVNSQRQLFWYDEIYNSPFHRAIALGNVQQMRKGSDLATYKLKYPGSAETMTGTTLKAPRKSI